MPLDRKSVERVAGEHIRELQQSRYVSAEEKVAIRKLHEEMAAKAARKAK